MCMQGEREKDNVLERVCVYALREIKIMFLSVCVCVCVRACVRACVRVCVRLF